MSPMRAATRKNAKRLNNSTRFTRRGSRYATGVTRECSGEYSDPSEQPCSRECDDLKKRPVERCARIRKTLNRCAEECVGGVRTHDIEHAREHEGPQRPMPSREMASDDPQPSECVVHSDVTKSTPGAASSRSPNGAASSSARGISFPSTLTATGTWSLSHGQRATPLKSQPRTPSPNRGNSNSSTPPSAAPVSVRRSRSRTSLVGLTERIELPKGGNGSCVGRSSNVRPH